MTDNEKKIVEQARQMRGWPYIVGYPLLTWLFVADLDPKKFRAPIYTLFTNGLRKIRPYNFSNPFVSSVFLFLALLYGSGKANVKRMVYMAEEFSKIDSPLGQKMREE